MPSKDGLVSLFGRYDGLRLLKLLRESLTWRNMSADRVLFVVKYKRFLRLRNLQESGVLIAFQVRDAGSLRVLHVLKYAKTFIACG